MTKYAKVLLLIGALAGCSNYVAGIGSTGTFIVAVGTERFRVRIDNALLANKARRMMIGAVDQEIVTGTLDRGNGGFNTGYNWHIKPATVSFTETTIELCDGRPSDIEANITYWVDTVKQYCPWSGRIVAEVGK
jgi:hypothetical protein